MQEYIIVERMILQVRRMKMSGHNCAIVEYINNLSHFHSALFYNELSTLAYHFQFQEYFSTRPVNNSRVFSL